MSAEMKWDVTPDQLAKNIQQYGDRVLEAIFATCSEHAIRLQSRARSNAPWEDRTGNARTGIFGKAVREGKVITIHLGHTVHYGIYLELSNGGKYAIIMPTIEQSLPELRNLLQELLR